MSKAFQAAALMYSSMLMNPFDLSRGGMSIDDIDFTPKQPPIPKGCKEYFFNTLGDFLNKNDGVYCFKCIAINDRSAIRKFEKWRDAPPTTT